MSNFEMTFSNSNGSVRTVLMNLKPADVVNFDLAYYFTFRNQNRFFLACGYSLALYHDDLIEVISGTLYTNEVSAMRVLQPAGVILGLGFEFAL